MADISFLVFDDEQGFYRLEGDDPNNQVRINMTPAEANAWIGAHAQPLLQECPYCHALHEIQVVEQCPLKPKQGNGRIDP